MNKHEFDKLNLTNADCVAILKHQNEMYEINQQFKTLPQDMQDNAKNVLSEFLSEVQ